MSYEVNLIISAAFALIILMFAIVGLVDDHIAKKYERCHSEHTKIRYKRCRGDIEDGSIKSKCYHCPYFKEDLL